MASSRHRNRRPDFCKARLRHARSEQISKRNTQIHSSRARRKTIPYFHWASSVFHVETHDQNGMRVPLHLSRERFSWMGHVCAIVVVPSLRISYPIHASLIPRSNQESASKSLSFNRIVTVRHRGMGSPTQPLTECSSCSTWKLRTPPHTHPFANRIEPLHFLRPLPPDFRVSIGTNPSRCISGLDSSEVTSLAVLKPSRSHRIIRIRSHN